MKSRLKKASAYLIIFVLLINSFAYAHNKNIDNTYSEHLYSTFVENVIEGYLLANGKNGNDLYLSNLVDYYDEHGEKTSVKVAYIFENDTIIGQLTVDCVNGNFCSSYTEATYLSTINACYRNCIPFALITTDGNLIIKYSDSYEVLIQESSFESNSSTSSISDNDRTSLCTLHKSRQIIFNNDSLQNRSYNITLSVPFVSNATNPYDGKGLCWAACIASIVNFKKGTNYSAMNVYYRCWQSVNCSSTDIPTGSVFWTNRAFSLYTTTMTHLSGGMTGNSVYSHINLNRPILAWITGVTSTGSSVAHDIVIAGINYMGSSGYYYIMDPNVSTGYVTVFANSGMWFTTNTFNYSAPTGSTYTGWANSWY